MKITVYIGSKHSDLTNPEAGLHPRDVIKLIDRWIELSYKDTLTVSTYSYMVIKYLNLLQQRQNIQNELEIFEEDGKLTSVGLCSIVDVAIDIYTQSCSVLLGLNSCERCGDRTNEKSKCGELLCNDCQLLTTEE